ncbi:MFS transporter [Candidatus Rhodobacter oscarellae]|nr:MFS transporter [Candidatus Rhodobacter lobularis]
MATISARKRIWGWMMFDWATQPFYTVLLTFIFGPYFGLVMAEHFAGQGLEQQAAEARAQSSWATMLTITGLFIAFTAPVLGAIADTRDRRIPWMVLFSLVYIAGTYTLWHMVPDGSAMMLTLIAFGIAMVSAEYMLVFINSMLPTLSKWEDIGEHSGNGFALGYAGGVLALLLVLVLFAEQGNGKTLIGLDPVLGLDAAAREGTRAVGPITMVWFVIFMIPFFLWVRDPVRPNITGSVGDALRQLGRSIAGVTKKPSLFAYLGSSMFYRDALNAIYGFGGFYAGFVLQWEITLIGIFGIVGAVSAALFSWLGGKMDRRFGPKPVIVVNAWILIVVCIVILNMTRESFFGIALAEGSGLPDAMMFILGAAIGGAGGSIQGASRTMMARHADPERPTEAFGLYAFSGKATAFLAPALIAAFTTITQNARLGLAPVVVLFIIALVLLRWVDPEGSGNRRWSGHSG